MNITWKGSFKRTELILEGEDYEIFEKIDKDGNKKYSIRGQFGRDMNNGELLRKLLKIKEKKNETPKGPVTVSDLRFKECL